MILAFSQEDSQILPGLCGNKNVVVREDILDPSKDIDRKNVFSNSSAHHYQARPGKHAPKTRHRHNRQTRIWLGPGELQPLE